MTMLVSACAPLRKDFSNLNYDGIKDCADILKNETTNSYRDPRVPRDFLTWVVLPNRSCQKGILTKLDKSNPNTLVVLLPGGDGDLRLRGSKNYPTISKGTSNFLTRSRNNFVSENVATLLIDCSTQFNGNCSDAYRGSPKRYDDISKLVIKLKKEQSSIKHVWVVGTSRGVISAITLGANDRENLYSGFVYTSSFLSKSISGNWVDEVKAPQFLIHHKDDPCRATKLSTAKWVSEKYNLPLLVLEGGDEFYGDACKAYTQHGFKGIEGKAVNEILRIISKFAH
jgi:hypothetical protein